MQKRRDEAEARFAEQRAAAMKRRDERAAEDARLNKEYQDRVAADRESYEKRVADERAAAAIRKEERDAELAVERQQNYNFLKFVKMQLTSLSHIENLKTNLS